MAAMQSIIGDYRIVARIDEGGMGAVFRAQHVTLGHEVAIKLLPTTLATDPNAQQWFRRGAASAAALQHPNILPVYHYGEHDGAPYLVMPYITGGTLKDRLLRGPLTFAEIVRVLAQLTAALDFAHSQGVVHRDVKPANLLLDERGTLYLADFGIAKALESATKFTRTGTTIGTPEYMAPEQARGHADHRSDLYAAGIILYQLLTGQVPFTGDSAVEILMQHIQDPPPLAPVRAVRPALPAAIEPVVARALAKRPEERYQRGADLVADLSAALTGATERPNAGLPDNRSTVVTPHTPTPQPVAQQAVLAPTPAPYAATPPPFVPAAATPRPLAAPPPVRDLKRPNPRNPLVIVLSVALAAVLLLSSVAGVGAWVIIRPTPTPNIKMVALVDPTATPLPPTPTPLPIPTFTPTRVPTATATPSPTNTPRPTNTPTPRPTSTQVPVNVDPVGTIPGAGWRTYRGSAATPFAIYYPGDWTIEPSSSGGVAFWAPGNIAFLIIAPEGVATSRDNIDALRGEHFDTLVSTCIQLGCKYTSSTTGYDSLSPTFAWQTGAMAYPDGRTFSVRDGVALNNGHIWSYNFSVISSAAESVWAAETRPMLISLNIYGNPR